MTQEIHDDALHELGRAFDALQDTDTTIDPARRAAFVQRAQEIPMIRRREMIATVALGAMLATSGVLLATLTTAPSPPETITIQTRFETPVQFSALQQPLVVDRKSVVLEPDSEIWDGPVHAWQTNERDPTPSFNGPVTIVEKPPRAVASVHMVGIYKTPLSPLAGRFKINKPMNVTIDAPGDAILVLSAYEATNWDITVGPRTNLREIVTNGHHEQNVLEVTHEGPMAGERVPVPVRTLRRALGTAFAPFHTWTPERPVAGKLAPHVYEALESQRQATQRIGAPISHFYGCHDMDSIHIGSSGVRAHSCDESAGYALDVHHLK